MCDGMRIDRRLILIGVMLVVLSMTMATQYAVTKVGYSFGIVHPSDADIRFIGNDNASDGKFLLRVAENTSTDQALIINLGNLSSSQNKTYTAAFGIVNEENFSVNITHVNITADSGVDYVQIWFHGNPNLTAENDASAVYAWNKGIDPGDFSASTCIWQLAGGDGNVETIDGPNLETPWDERAHIRYSRSEQVAINITDDYVWVQVSVTPDRDADSSATYSGEIWIHTKADTN